MINTNERLKHKYAYNINDSTKIREIKRKKIKKIKKRIKK